MYAYALAKETMLTYRSQFHGGLIGLAHDEVMRFFVLQLERLRNNQFDIDQILKKGAPDELKLVELEPLVRWRLVEGGELTLTAREELSLDAVGTVLKEIFGEGELPSEHLLFSIFNETSFDESVSQLRGKLESSEF
jgi:hypothetical protein